MMLLVSASTFDDGLKASDLFRTVLSSLDAVVYRLGFAIRDLIITGFDCIVESNSLGPSTILEVSPL